LACFSRRATAWTPDAMVPSRLLCPVSQPSDVFWQPEDEPNTLLSTSVLHTTTSSRVEDSDHDNTTQPNVSRMRPSGVVNPHSWHRSLRTPLRDDTSESEEKSKGEFIAHCDEFSAGRFHSASQCQPKITLPREYIHNSKPRLRPP
jgi:hypothetical protein